MPRVCVGLLRSVPRAACLPVVIHPPAQASCRTKRTSEQGIASTQTVFFPFHSLARASKTRVQAHGSLSCTLSLVCSCCCCAVQPFTWAILRSLLRHEPTHRESKLALLRIRAPSGVRSQLDDDDDDVKICIGVQRRAIAERRTQARHQTIA